MLKQTSKQGIMSFLEKTKFEKEFHDTISLIINKLIRCNQPVFEQFIAQTHISCAF
jgi:hypothetical protein